MASSMGAAPGAVQHCSVLVEDGWFVLSMMMLVLDEWAIAQITCQIRS
jgi:hypothetical protein